MSILVVDDEPDVADLFRQRFRREARQGTYVMHLAASGAEVLDRLAEDERRRRARELGAFQFLPKPIDFYKLKAQLGQLPDAAN